MVECELRHELVNVVNPGDAVYVTGIVEVNSQKGYFSLRWKMMHGERICILIAVF